MMHKLLAFEAMNSMTYIASEPVLVEMTIGALENEGPLLDLLMDIHRPVELEHMNRTQN
jgi:hypothetical protein